MRKPRVNFWLLGRRTALMVCHAMSIAMTVVLPAPVASFNASRMSSGLASLLAFFRWSRIALAGFAGLWRNFGQPDGGFHRLDLTEKRADAGEFMLRQCCNKPGGFRRHLPLFGLGRLRH
jgi:hypothetical protein